MDVRLIMFKEDGEAKEFPLDPGKTIVGRKEECDLRIPLPEISRQHALMIVSDTTVTLRDLGSANGTYVNNSRIAEEDLAPGDHIVIGPVVFTVQINGEPAAVRPVQTRLEARSTAAAAAVSQQGTPPEPKPDSERDEVDIFGDDDDDPISALEALAASDDTAALDLDDSFDDTEEDGG